MKKPDQVNGSETTRASRLSKYKHVTVSEIQRAKTVIVKCVQIDHFSHDIRSLKATEITEIPSSRKELCSRHKFLNGKSQLYKLEPFLDQNGLL